MSYDGTAPHPELNEMDGATKDASNMMVEGGSRKRQRTSPETGHTPRVAAPAKMGSIVSESEQAVMANAAPCEHEQRIKAFNNDVETMRQLITCKICQRFLYEPYVLACGHTYCYSCLDQWIGPNKKNTCPDCRSVIKQLPSYSYLVREMVLIFVNRRELLPEGETVDEHLKFAKEEAEIVSKDRITGLFKGCFGNRGRLANYAIHDSSDNVDRCPHCLTEVEDGYCNVCNLRIRTDHDDHDSSDGELSDELDHELEDMDTDVEFGLDGYADAFYGSEDDSDVETDALRHAWDVYPADERPRRAFPLASRGRRPPRHLADDDEEEESGDEDPTMDGFVVDDSAAIEVDTDSNSDSGSNVTEVADTYPPPRQRQHRRLGTHVVVSDGDEPIPNAHRQSSREISSSVGDSSSEAEQDSPSSENDSDDETPIRAGTQRTKNRARARLTRPFAVDSDEEEEAEDRGTSRSGTLSPTLPNMGSMSGNGSLYPSAYEALDEIDSDNDVSHEDEDEGEDESEDEDEHDDDDDDEDDDILGGHYGDGYHDDDDDDDDHSSIHGLSWWGPMSSQEELQCP